MNALALWNMVAPRTMQDHIASATKAEIAEANNRRSKHWEGEERNERYRHGPNGLAS